jgi:RNA recognition motif-containing protein
LYNIIATTCITDSEFFSFLFRMEGGARFDHSELVLRRTVHISDIDGSMNEKDLLHLLSPFGPVERVHFEVEEAEQTRMALVQFQSEEVASQAIRASRLTFKGSSMRISPSRVTIDVIPPTDAVFGKPLTVGRHVMAVNPSHSRGRTSALREAAYEKACHAAADVLVSISERTGWPVPAGEIQRLRNRSTSFDTESNK